MSPKEKSPISPTLDVEQAVADFYIVLMAESQYDPNVTNESRLAMFNRVKDRVIHPLAQAFFDYIVVVCAAEMRHAFYRCNYHYVGFPTARTHRREATSLFALEFEPRRLLQAASRLFDENAEIDGQNIYWEGSFGGTSWKKIAEAGLLFGTVPDTVFIDHCVDLSHNSGLFLDKGVIFENVYESRYVGMLDRKRDCMTMADFVAYLNERTIPVSMDTLPLISRGASEDLASRTTVNPSWRYTPVNWGKREFDFAIHERTVDPYDESESCEEETPQEPQVEECSEREEGF